MDLHFKTEEALMAEANYPGLTAHVSLHKELVEKTRQLSINAIRDRDSEVILKFLKEWWLGHINKQDRQYAPFLIKLIG